MLEGTICELLTSCGDARGRFRACAFSYGLQAGVAESLLPSLRAVWARVPRSVKTTLPAMAVLALMFYFMITVL